MSKIYCLNCGEAMNSDTKFCPSCGAQNTQFSGGEDVVVDTTANVISEEPLIPDPAKEDVSSGSSFESTTTSSSSQGTYSYSSNTGNYSYSSNTGSGSNLSGDLEGSKGLAIASMVLGIVSLVCCCWFGLFGAIFPIVGLVLGIVSITTKKGGKGMAIAGIICSGIALILSIILGISTIGESTSVNVDTDDFFEILEDMEDDLF